MLLPAHVGCPSVLQLPGSSSLKCNRKTEGSQIVPVPSPFPYFKLITIPIEVSTKTITLESDLSNKREVSIVLFMKL